MRKLLALMAVFVACAGALAQSKSLYGDDITGQYSFLRDGEFIQLNLQNGVLEGWVSSYGFLDSDRETKLDRMFKKATLDGNQIYFITSPLHGSWVEFSGRIERGEARTRDQAGYYRLVGRLIEYTTDADHNQSVRQRDAVFKSAPSITEAGLAR